LAAPTVLDLEQGTYRLAWTQSVTRRRWLAGKLGYGLVIAVRRFGALVALGMLWCGTLADLNGRIRGRPFGFAGAGLRAYTLFPFCLCRTVGAVLRRRVPMIGIGLVGFLVARIGVLNQLRPHYLDPVTLTWDPTEPAPAAVTGRFSDGSLVLSRGFETTGGSS